MGFGHDIERRITNLLDRVPGYRGYRAKEDRRDADKRVREHVAAAFDAQADRVERVGRDLASRRRIMDVGPVDEFARTLRHLIDRIRTATYGYGGLMGDRDVDETALDQLRHFDEGLLSGVDELEPSVATIESALTANGDLAAPARAGTDQVRVLLRRLDLRGDVIETGTPAPQDSVLAVLEPPKPDAPPPAFDLHEGDALAILGDDYLVDSRIDVDAGDQSFRLFRLTGGTDDQWLLVPKRSGEPVLLLSPAQVSTSNPQPTVIAGTPFTTQSTGSGQGQVIGVGGKSDWRTLNFTFLTATNDPDARAVIIDWGPEQQTLNGRVVHHNDLDIFGTPSADLN